VGTVPVIKVVDGVVTTGSDLVGIWFIHTAIWKEFAVEITKGSPNYTVNMYLCSTVNATQVTEASFLDNERNDLMARVQHTYQTAQTIAVDEATDGTLDHVNIAWNNANDIWLNAITVRRIR
jgi:hypothetical protein